MVPRGACFEMTVWFRAGYVFYEHPNEMKWFLMNLSCYMGSLMYLQGGTKQNLGIKRRVCKPTACSSWLNR